jgi:hypothetical protein
LLSFRLTKSYCFFINFYFPAENSRSQKSQLSIHTNVGNKPEIERINMNTHADKTQENKSQAASVVDSQMQSGGESALQFVDNRPEAMAQMKLQEMANNSPQVSQLMAFQDMANNSPQAEKAAQLQTMADNHSAQQQQPTQKKENNTGLPDNLKTGMENLSGMSLDDVKVHRNSDKPAQLQAHAYAQGTDIHLASGQEKHLPHEAWHVVQQKQGRVKPTTQMKGKVNVNDDAGLEKEADVMGVKALQVQEKKSNKTTLQKQETTQLKSAPIQFGCGSSSLAGVEIKETVKPDEKCNDEEIPDVDWKTGMTQAIMTFLFQGKGKVESVAEGLAAYAVEEKKETDPNLVTPKKVEEYAIGLGYDEVYATRLANKNPFKKEEIMNNTEVKGDMVNSFTFSSRLEDSASYYQRGGTTLHNLNFMNYYREDGSWEMKFNARNPALSDFTADDVYHEQSKMAYKEDKSPSAIIRVQVNSKSGLVWYNKNKPELNTELSEEHLKSFLSDTVNGKSSLRTAESYKKEIISGLIKENGSQWDIILRLSE